MRDSAPDPQPPAPPAGDGAVDGPDPETVHRQLGLALVGGIASLAAYGGGVFLCPEGGETLDLAVAAGLPPQFGGPWRRIPLASASVLTEAYRERRVVWIGDTGEAARKAPRAALVLPYRFSYGCAPLLGAGAVHGVVFVNWPSSHAPRLAASERRGLTAMAGLIGEVLAREAAAGRTVAAPEEPADFSAATPGPGTADCAASARLPEGVCALGVDGRVSFATPSAAALLGVDRNRLGEAPTLWEAAPWLDRPLHVERFREAAMSRAATGFVADRGDGTRLAVAFFPDATGITVRVTETDAPATDPDETGPNETGPDETDPDATGPAGTAPPPAAPPADRPLPVRPAAAHTPRPPRPAAPSPLRLEHTYQLLHLAGALAEADGVGDVVSLLAHGLLPVIGAQRIMVLAESEDGSLRVTGAHGHDPENVRRLDRALPAWVAVSVRTLDTGSPVFLESRADLNRVAHWSTELSEGAAWAVLPLADRSRTFGICVLSFDEPRRFSPEERATLTAFTGLIGRTLTRASRFDAADSFAKGLREALLPRALPPVPGVEVTAEYRSPVQEQGIGGDFHDIVRLDETTIAAIVGDVQGHNALAAGLMGQVRAAVRAFATAGATPGVVLERTNRLLIDLDTGLLASAAYVELDLEKHTLVMSRAGHPRPVICDPDGWVSWQSPSGGMLLGVEREAEYRDQRLELPPGSILALFSDGLIDTPGTDPDEVLAGLTDRLTGPASAQPLGALARALIAGAPRTDDTTVLLLRAVPV